MDETTDDVKDGQAFAHLLAVADACCRRSGARPGAMGNNTIKTHLVLHLCEDILDHGVPDNVNSAYAESAHIPLAKATSRNTQKRAISFTKQAANRYTENLVISLASTDVENDVKRNVDSSAADVDTLSPMVRVVVVFTLHGRKAMNAPHFAGLARAPETTWRWPIFRTE
ncbi:hypothetical protein MHU86_19722 [Fragilaria crotonensis]|nr:hypothetical protein MHU86_19722 [Fragilaria crotonensis]